ncbi:uncharacterized protein PgNI_08626 [Pyricularia grisea]|uniref:Uncharacterized protein n=1 Tax=Pyricularia grisea TaxID=148305 RepID=A0A6P8AV72_PYRGI|nr:uncharacterized protein PgNI_08626 [Pyricularia grisea]TLD06112.1 hypothetical protein PgNI_08626 [Pyricularia grisea]
MTTTPASPMLGRDYFMINPELEGDSAHILGLMDANERKGFASNIRMSSPFALGLNALAAGEETVARHKKRKLETEQEQVVCKQETGPNVDNAQDDIPSIPRFRKRTTKATIASPRRIPTTPMPLLEYITKAPTETYATYSDLVRENDDLKEKLDKFALHNQMFSEEIMRLRSWEAEVTKWLKEAPEFPKTV